MLNNSENVAFVRNCWYVAAWDYEVPVGAPVRRMLVGEPIVLFRTANGAIAALEDRCAHRHSPLSLGRVEGNYLRCMYHGLCYDAEGRCVEVPGQETIPPQAVVRVYPAIEQSSWIWIWMGDPAKADPTLIPAARGLDDTDWVLGAGQLDYDAPYNLINDNLLDLSHLSYVHAASFGADPKWANTRPLTKAIDRGVRVQRWIEDAPPLPPLESLSMHKRVDIWSTYDFIIPGIFLLYTALYPTGTALACKNLEPSSRPRPLFTHFTSQAVTPTSSGTSRYFFSWGPGSDFGGQEIADVMINVAKQAFLEDKRVIEAQARTIEMKGHREMVLTSADKTVTIFNRIMARAAKDVAASE